MKLVRPKLQAHAITDKTEIDNYIKSVYDGIVDKNSLRYLPSFILFVCCVVEECYAKKTIHNSKINKRDEVLQHICNFLGTPFSETDKNIIISIIEDLHSSGRIKRVSFVSKLIFNLGSWFLKNN
jgi:hypothetical protein